MTSPRKYKVLGLMSGTSLDGLDLALVEFGAGKRWTFQLLASKTLPYNAEWKARLTQAHLLPAAELLSLDAGYGAFLGQQCNKFLSKNKVKRLDAIASHGHTVFHQPEKGFTFQLGDGQAIHSVTGIPVVSDFRSLDVKLGGEGAPLVPIGDRLLFASYDICLNLGGIANLSMESNGKRIAFDVCFCNMALNHLMREKGASFDKNGRTAAGGAVDRGLLESIQVAYGAIRKGRKSIGREFFERAIQPILDKSTISLANKLRTVCESVAIEVAAAIPSPKKNLELLATGGGALNKFLVKILKERLQGRASVVLPSREIIEFKEAIVFAFLGVLRMRNEINVLRSVTKASRDSSSGVLIGRIGS